MGNPCPPLEINVSEPLRFLLTTTLSSRHFQDVVEERFNMEYLIAMIVATILVTLISFVAVTLMVMRCRRMRDKRRLRKASLEQQPATNMMIRDVSASDSVSTQV